MRQGRKSPVGALRADFALAEKDTLYRCLDRLRPHQAALHLTAKWRDLFGVKFDLLLYDLTSTYFESDPPFVEGDPRHFGYSRDKRPDCVQVVIRAHARRLSAGLRGDGGQHLGPDDPARLPAKD